MNTADMKAALGAFKRCKKVLSWGGDHYGPNRYICNSLLGEGSSAAKGIVIRSLDGHDTYRAWLSCHSWQDAEICNNNDIQAGRHAFVDACIAELKRRIAAATGAKP